MEFTSFTKLDQAEPTSLLAYQHAFAGKPKKLAKRSKSCVGEDIHKTLGFISQGNCRAAFAIDISMHECVN